MDGRLLTVLLLLLLPGALIAVMIVGAFYLLSYSESFA